MGTVVYLTDGAASREARAAPPMRQPGRTPASQFVSIGTIARNLVEKWEREMNKKAVTNS